MQWVMRCHLTQVKGFHFVALLLALSLDEITSQKQKTGPCLKNGFLNSVEMIQNDIKRYV